MVGGQLMKRVPLIKFPQRHHPKIQPQGSSPSTEQQVDISRLGFISQQKVPASSANAPSYRFRSQVPAPPSITGVGGKASMLPKRTPVSEKEIDAILLGGCF